MGGWQLITLSATKERKLNMDAQNFTFFFILKCSEVRNSNRYANEDRRKTKRPQSYPKNHRQLKNAEGG